jgi:ATP phosphoribosyltransferase regulatory subunit
MTPQAARIDAHLLNRQGVARLCYAGPVLRTRPAGLLAGREPFQIGAELFGHAGIEADLEIQGLLLAALNLAGVPNLRLSLGHAGLFRALAEGSGLEAAAVQEMFAALRQKDAPTVEALSASLPHPWRDAFRALPELYGDAEALERAARLLPDLPAIRAALDDLARLLVAGQGADIRVDLSDLRGDGYHNGVMFAAYAGGQARAVALGGRYDGAGAVFGRRRPATGFSLDLRQLLDCLPEPAPRGGILVPLSDDPDLARRVAELRAAGERVVVAFPSQEAHPAETGCDRSLVKTAEGWIIH